VVVEVVDWIAACFGMTAPSFVAGHGDFADTRNLAAAEVCFVVAGIDPVVSGS
jgi:hypothetical protein